MDSHRAGHLVMALFVSIWPLLIAARGPPGPLQISDPSPLLIAAQHVPVQVSAKQGPGQISNDQGPRGPSAKQGPEQISTKQGPGRVSAKQGPGRVSAKQGPGGISAEQGPVGVSAEPRKWQIPAQQGPGEISAPLGPGDVAALQGPGQGLRLQRSGTPGVYQASSTPECVQTIHGGLRIALSSGQGHSPLMTRFMHHRYARGVPERRQRVLQEANTTAAGTRVQRKRVSGTPEASTTDPGTRVQGGSLSGTPEASTTAPRVRVQGRGVSGTPEANTTAPGARGQGGGGVSDAPGANTTAPGTRAQGGSGTSGTPEASSRNPGLSVPAVWAFGDANTCTGNDDFRNSTPLRSDFAPYGRLFFGRPTGRASDGRLVVDFLTQYLRLPLLPPSLRPGANFSAGASFATGGASATASSFEPGWGSSLPQQVEGFLDLRRRALAPGGTRSSLLPTQKSLEEALYFIQIGEVNFLQLIIQAQAMGALAPQFASFVQPRVQSDVLQSIQESVQKLYAAGARRFLVMAVLPTGCAPLIRAASGNSSCVAFANTMVETFNDALAKSLQSLRANLTGSTIILARADRVLLRILSDPPASGFDKNLDACCGSGTFNGVGPCGVLGYTVCPKAERRVYWDQFHNSQMVFALMAQEAWEGTQDVVEPINLRNLSTP